MTQPYRDGLSGDGLVRKIVPEWQFDDIGAPLLISLAEGLYRPEEVIREYVQNAYDSYVDLRRETGLSSDSSIQVRIDANNREVHIYDDGIGMDENDLITAKSLGVSKKLQNPDDFAGFRGIGIWSGLSTCELLVVETTKFGVPFLYKMAVDFKAIRERVYEPIPIKQLLDGKIEIEEIPYTAEEHFTQVSLLNVDTVYNAELVDENR